MMGSWVDGGELCKLDGQQFALKTVRHWQVTTNFPHAEWTDSLLQCLWLNHSHQDMIIKYGSGGGPIHTHLPIHAHP